MSNTSALLLAYLQTLQPISFWLLPAGTATSASQVKQLTPSQAAKASQDLATPTTALIAASGLSLFNLELPPGVKADEALLLVEDELSQPLEEVTTAVISQAGREVCLAVISNDQLVNWQEELADAEIYNLKWQAETPALSHLWPQEEPLVLINNETASLEIWLANSQSLLNLPLSLLEEQEQTANNQLTQLLASFNINAPLHIQTTSLAAKLVWLAPALAQQAELWPLSWWQKLLNHPKLRQVSQLKNLISQGLAYVSPYKRQLLPWGLSLGVVLIAGLFNLLQPQQAEAYLSQTAKQFENQLGLPLTHSNANQRLNQQLANLGEQLSYQESRFNAWQQLHQLLKNHPETQLTSLELSPAGLTAQLTVASKENLGPLSQKLHQLGGQLTQQENQLTWQLTQQEVEGF